MRTRFVPFDKLPITDTCWSLIEGPDERVYAAACCEHSAGGTVFVVRYDPRTEELEYLLDVADVGGEPFTSGRATQCKIHYSMLIDEDGVLYGATHLSGPAVGQIAYNPWGTFDDPDRSFIASKVFAYDTKTEEVLWTDDLIPWEGCRCMALDAGRRRIYVVGYPRDHFYAYDLDTHELTDYGRIGSVNPQAIWLDSRGRAYTTDDYGRVLVFDPETDRLDAAPVSLPCAAYQDGWHNVVYDAVRVPGSDDVAGVAWNIDPRLFRFSPGSDGGECRMTDLGPARPGIDGYAPRGMNGDHAGGLVFAADGSLLYTAIERTMVKNFPRDKGMLKRMNAETGEVSHLGLLTDEETGRDISYISRAVRIGAEHLVMGTIGRVPVGIVHVVLDGDITSGPFEATPRRHWG